MFFKSYLIERGNEQGGKGCNEYYVCSFISKKAKIIKNRKIKEKVKKKKQSQTTCGMKDQSELHIGVWYASFVFPTDCWLGK